ncbi:MAG: DUF6531 domain-containing protein [Chloroflexi bacterium]|nr:DUF6531 domain-containing protein [Chloroflexota bacterium]MCC6895927.1 hypothetical protein [Anaerolineae bacterium]
MKPFRFNLASLMFVFLLGFGLVARPTTAQDAPEQPAVTDTCADVRYLMARDTTPDQLLRGGGVLEPSTPAGGQVGAGNDMGDHWVFSVDGATNSTTMNVTFTDLPADLPLEFALFQGMTRVTPTNTYQPITPDETYTLSTRDNGIYTLVVQLANISDLERLTDTFGYIVTADFQSGGDPLAAINTRRIRDTASNQDLALNQDYEVLDGKQVFTFRSGAVFKTNPAAVQAVNQMPDKAGRLDFDGGGTLIVDNWAREISLLGGNLSVIGTLDEAQRTYFIENFGAGQSLINNVQSDLRDITDSNRTHIVTDWQGITGVWVMTDCMGYKLADGRTFTVAVDNTLTQRDFQVLGAAAGAQTCPDFLSRFKGLNATGQTVDQSVCMSWSPVEAGTEVTMLGGVLNATLVEGRSITLQSDSIRMTALANATNADSDDLPLDIQVVDGTQPVSIKLDWTNLADFAYADDGANGRTLRFGFLDEPRTSTTRPGVELLSLDAIDDVLHIVYRGAGANASGGRELILLPRGESYLEIVTPAGTPTFNGAVFNGQALPDEAGYQPRGLNNLGGECAPINTLLDQFNCAPNGDINPANGNLWYAITDLTAYHPVFDLALTRSYNSYNMAGDGAFGRGWTSDFPLDYTIAFDDSTNSRVVDLANTEPETRTTYRLGLDPTWAARGILTLTTASGSIHQFVRDANATAQGETYRALTMPGWTLTRAGANALAWLRSDWTLTYTDGLTYTFDRAGRMRRFGYPAQGYTATIHYPWADNLEGPGALGDQPVTITDSTNTRQIELYYDDAHHIVTSRLRDLTQSDAASGTCNLDESCFETQYTYTGDFLTGVTYPDGQQAAYEYDEMGRLIRHDDPHAPVAPIMGYTYFTAEEDTPAVGQGAVTAAYILKPDEPTPNAETSFAWRRLETVTGSGTRAVTVTDEYGAAHRYTYTRSSGSLTGAGDSYTLAQTENLWAAAGSFEAVPTKYEWAAGQLAAVPTRFLPGATNIGRSRVDLDTNANGQISGLSGGYPGVSITPSSDAVGQFPVRQIVPSQITFANGSGWTFGGYNADGFFTTYTDSNGAHYTVERDEANRPTRVTRSEDQVTWTLTYNEGGYVSSVQQSSAVKDDTGYSVQYEWDGLGRLVAVADDLLGAYRINYTPATGEADGSITSAITVTDPSGAVTVSRFDGRGRLIETRLQTAADSEDYLSRTTYEYDTADLLGRVSASVRWLAGADGEVELRTTYHYQAQPQLDQVGEAVTIGGTRVTQTDAYGRETVAVYDALGRIRLLGDASGLTRRFDYTVSSVQNPLPANSINPNGLKIVQQDYQGGRLTATTDYLFDYGWQLSGVIRREQNPFAAAPGTWSAEWRLFSQTVNALNPNVRSLIAPVEAFPDPGIVWGDSYTNGRPTSITAQRTNPLTGRPDIDPNLKTAIDFLGRPTEITQTVSGALQTTYISYCPAANGGTLELRALPAAPALSCDRPAGVALALTYDAHHRLTGTIDATTRRDITYSTDVNNGGTLVNVQASSLSGGTIYTWALHYDAAGQLTAWTDEYGVEHLYTYDTLGRLAAVTVTDQPQASFTFTYNTASLLVQQVDGTGRGTAYAYDAAGRLILQQDVLTKNSVSYTYDTLGRLSSQISPLGSVTTYEYNDPVNPARLSAIITAAGREQFAWNDARATLTYTNPTGRQTVYTFDGLGALWQVNTPEGRLYQLLYNDAGSLTGWQVREGSSSRIVTLGYDDANNRVTLGAEGAEWTWALDFTAAGDLAAVTNPAGQKLGLTYDPLGKLAAITAANKPQWQLEHPAGEGELTVTDAQGSASTYTFDSLYRLIESQRDDATTGIEYVWSGDTNGLVNARLTDTGGTSVYTFWPGDERQPPQIIVRTSGQKLTYTYNTEGLLESINREVCLVAPFADVTSAELDQIDQFSPAACEDETSPDVWLGTTRFLYDTLGQPIRTIDAEQNAESFTYDAAGNLVSYQNPDGKTYTYSYDGLNRVSRITSPAGIDLLFTYTLDNVAGICQSRSLDRLDYAGCAAAGGVVSTYTYDGLGRRLGESFPLVGSTGQFTWAYGAAGGGAPTEANGQPLTYDAFGLLKTSGETGFAYTNPAALGSISGANGLTITYDKKGRPAILEIGDQSLSISYAADGGYTLRDDISGATLRFALGGSGLLETVDYKPGNPDEATPALQIQYIGQEPNGLTSFSLLWGDGYITDFRANRRGENIYLNHQTQDFDLGLTLDTVHSAGGLLQRQVITGGSASGGYFNGTVTGGTITVRGYDQNDRLLTMRVSESEGSRLLYQATYVYNDFGQLIRETRQYEGGTQAVLNYRYDTAARNLLVATDVSISEAAPEQAVSGVVIFLLLGSGGAVGLRRYGSRRLLNGVVALALVFSLMNITAAQDAPTPVIQARYTYAYDERGSLVSVTPTGGEVCTTYAYDSANQLTGVTSGDQTTTYRYDAYGRLIAAGATKLVYVGDATTPLMVIENGEPRFYAQTADGTLLFSASGESLSPFISSGDRQVLGQRPYGTAETADDVRPMWVFDPFGRYLALDAPSAAEPCALLAAAPDASIPNFMPALNGMVWDTQTNLYFGGGRAYSPALARYLQRDPLGADAHGSVYDFAASRSTPPLRNADVPYLEGLAHLSAASAVEGHLTNLNAAAITGQYAPSPLGTLVDPLAAALPKPEQAQTAAMTDLLNLPVWLAQAYNLPGPQFDPATGALRLLADNAPGQGGWGAAAVADLQNGIFGNGAWQPTVPQTPQQQLAGLVGRTGIVPQRLTTYFNQAWQAPQVTLTDSWQSVTPDFSLANTPAAVLERLPRALQDFSQAGDVLALTQSIDDLTTLRGMDWVNRWLAQSLPALPELPPTDTAAWKHEWFTDALAEVEGAGIPLPELPHLPQFPLGLGAN